MKFKFFLTWKIAILPKRLFHIQFKKNNMWKFSRASVNKIYTKKYEIYFKLI